jgi:DNA modification methylase
MSVRRNHLLVGDAYHELAKLPTGEIDMVLTSPPYFRLRDYQIDGQPSGLRRLSTDGCVTCITLLKR